MMRPWTTTVASTNLPDAKAHEATSSVKVDEVAFETASVQSFATETATTSRGLETDYGRTGWGLSNTLDLDELEKEIAPTRFPSSGCELPDAISEQLARQREILRRERAALEEEKSQYALVKKQIEGWSPPANQRVKLNVSGQKIEVGANTVGSNLFFKALFSGSFAQPDQDGFFYLQREPKWVVALLKYLREGTIDLSCYSTRELTELKMEAEFLMIPDVVSLCASRLGPFLYSTLLEIPASGNGIVFELVAKRRLLFLHISFFPYTNSTEEIVVYHSEGGLSTHTSLHWYREYKGKLSLASALLCKIEFPKPLYLCPGRHTLSIHCSRNDSAISYTAKPNVIQPCEHFVFGTQAGLKADPEVPHGVDARFFVGKIFYSLYVD